MNSGSTRTFEVAQPPETLREIVQANIREAIFDGRLKPGQRLVERPLCEQLGVSRTVIRETIRFLEAEGLVEIVQNQGPIVASMNWETARQIYDVRKMLETAAAIACAKCKSETLDERLRGALATLASSYKQSTPGMLAKATSEFYQVIFEEAGHFVAWEIVQRLNGRISWLRLLTLSSADRHRSGLAHMESICNAILSADVTATRKSIDTHLKDASSVAERLLTETSGTSPN